MVRYHGEWFNIACAQMVHKKNWYPEVIHLKNGRSKHMIRRNLCASFDQHSGNKQVHCPPIFTENITDLGDQSNVTHDGAQCAKANKTKKRSNNN